MIPHNYGAMPSYEEVPVKKRRSRKKKPSIVDPEAERQEQELRMKIKKSLHTQQVLRTEVEEDEAQKNAANVANASMRGGGVVSDGQAHIMDNGQMDNMRLGGMSSMGYSGMQSSMGGVGMQQQQHQQQQYQTTPNTQSQQYGYPQDQVNPGMGGRNIPNMQREMQQMKQQLEIQRQHLEQQLNMKRQMEMQQRIQQPGQQQQSPAYFQSDGNQNNMGEVKLSSEEIMRSLKYEQERLLNEAQKRKGMTSIVNNMNGQPQSGPGTPSPQYIVNNMNAQPQSGPGASSPQYMPTQFQQHGGDMDSVGNNVNSPVPSGTSTSSPQFMNDIGNGVNSSAPTSGSSTPSTQYLNRIGNNMNNPAPQDRATPPPQYMPARHQQSPSNRSPQPLGGQSNQQQQFNQQNDGSMICQGIYTNQHPSQGSNNNATQYPNKFEDRGQQQYQPSQSYHSEKGAALSDQEIIERYNQLMGQSKQNLSTNDKPLGPQRNEHYDPLLGQSEQKPSPRGQTLDPLKRSQETQGSAESWLKAGSINSSFSSGMAFNSVGNMSASFNSTISRMDSGGIDPVLTPSELSDNHVPNDVVADLGISVGGGNGINADSTKGTEEGGSDVRARVPARRSAQGHDNDATNNTSTNKGIALQPIQENETDDASILGSKFGQGSLMLSLMEDDLLDSNLSATGNNASSMSMNDFMSMDSTTFHALMKQSQSGTGMNYSMSDLIESATAANKHALETQKLPPSPPSMETNQGAPPERASNNQGEQCNSASTSSHFPPQNSQLETDSGSPMVSSVSMDNSNQPKLQNLNSITKRMSSSSKQGSARSGRSRSTVSKISMMSEISQWTQNNPFEDADSPCAGDGGAGVPSETHHQGDGDHNNDDSEGVDMGDFHSLAGSMNNSIDLSMMSSMTGSLRNLDLSTNTRGS